MSQAGGLGCHFCSLPVHKRQSRTICFPLRKGIIILIQKDTLKWVFKSPYFCPRSRYFMGKQSLSNQDAQFLELANGTCFARDAPTKERSSKTDLFTLSPSPVTHTVPRPTSPLLLATFNIYNNNWKGPIKLSEGMIIYLRLLQRSKGVKRVESKWKGKMPSSFLFGGMESTPMWGGEIMNSCVCFIKL